MKTMLEIVGKRAVYSVKPSLSVAQVVEYLCEKKVGAVAICQGQRVVGVFSERDLMTRVVRKGLAPKKVTIADVMTKDVYYVHMDESRSVARALMLNKNIRHLVVLDKKDRLKGFVSMRELIEVDLAESQELIRKLNDDYYRQEYEAP